VSDRLSLTGEDFSIATKDTLYRCLDRLLEHKRELFSFLRKRWEDLSGAKFDVLLYDLTSTYFESDPPFPEGDKRKFGYPRDKRSDCVQVVIALVITPEGFPLAYEVLAGNTAEKPPFAASCKRSRTNTEKAGGSGSSIGAFLPRKSLPRCAPAIRRFIIW
jgi:transposase